MTYEYRVWHRGYADWAWEVRSVDEGGACEMRRKGYKTSQAKAIEDARLAIAFCTSQDTAAWVKR